MVDDSSQALGIAVRAALIIPAALAAAGVDLTKYRAWRERRAHWRREGRPPPPEYARDNRLWQLRLTALIVGVLSFIPLTTYLFTTSGSDPRVIWSLYALSMIGCGVWGFLRARVR